jgi:hypothetical protein
MRRRRVLRLTIALLMLSLSMSAYLLFAWRHAWPPFQLRWVDAGGMPLLTDKWSAN